LGKTELIDKTYLRDFAPLDRVFGSLKFAVGEGGNSSSSAIADTLWADDYAGSSS
jgi:hypothetical protein